MKDLYKWIKYNYRNKNIDTWTIVGNYEWNLYYDNSELILAKYEIIPDCINVCEYFIKAKCIYINKNIGENYAKTNY